MANELCSDDSCTCPRISFSHEFSQTDVVPIEQRPPQSSSSNSYFCFRNDTINPESPASEELFLNGKIISIEIKSIISLSKHVQEQPLSPPPQPFLDATITSNDSRYDQGSKVIEITTSKENSNYQEFSSLKEHFLDGEIIIPVKIKKKKNIPPPFSPLGAFLDADGDIDEDICKGSNQGMIESARNKPPDGHEKKNLKSSSRSKMSSSLSCALAYMEGAHALFHYSFVEAILRCLYQMSSECHCRKGCHNHKLNLYNWMLFAVLQSIIIFNLFFYVGKYFYKKKNII